MIRGYVLTAATSAALGAGGAWYFAPRPVRVEYKDRVRVVTVRDTQRTKTRTVVKPDGTRITERTDTTTRSDSRTERRTESTTTLPPRWHVGGLLIAQPRLLPSIGADLYAGVLVTRQLVGPVSIGLTATVPVAHPVSIPAVGVTLGVSW